MTTAGGATNTVMRWIDTEDAERGLTDRGTSRAKTCRVASSLQFAALAGRISEGGMREVMLLTSRETHRWVVPKGWPMKGRKPAEVASREAYEEAGLVGQVVGKHPIGTTKSGSSRR